MEASGLEDKESGIEPLPPRGSGQRLGGGEWGGISADFRDHPTFLFRTQLFPCILRISLVFPVSEVRHLSPF